MLLTVERNSSGVVEIHLDQEGLDLLIDRLTKLKEHGGHDHLMTPSWSGWELTEDKQGTENELVNHLHIRLRPD